MKHSMIILALFILTGVLPAKADYIATHTFVVDAENTITIVVSGTLGATISGDSGALSTPLNLNFNIATNEDLENIRLRAHVVDSDAAVHGGFYCTGSGEVSSQSMHLVLASNEHAPTSGSIEDCKQATSNPENNSNAIAYPGTVAINNNGTVNYSANSGDGYFSCEVKTGTSDLNLTLNTTPKPGTYDAITALDEPDNFRAEIYLDNIP